MDKARKALVPISSLVAQFNIPSDKALYLFNSMIRPIAMYNSENLAQLTEHQINSVNDNKNSLIFYVNKAYPNTVHQKFLKFILGVKSNCSNLATLGELGEIPVILHGFASLLSFWHRINNMDENTIVKQALNFMTNDDSTKFEWLNTVKFLLHYLEMDDHFANPHFITNTKTFTTLCKKKLRNKFIEEWHNDLAGLNMKTGETSKLRFYKLFKTSFGREPYLDHIKDFNLRKIITKFRCSDHSLEIEVGRHKNLKVDERICKLCDKEDVESETHFLLLCPTYAQNRKHYFANIGSQNWLDTLLCKDIGTSYKLANFLNKSFNSGQKCSTCYNSSFARCLYIDFIFCYYSLLLLFRSLNSCIVWKPVG